MAENGIKSIVFPAMNVAGEAKLKRLVETITDYMGAKVTIETVMLMQANFPSDRTDIEAIYKRLAGSKTRLNMVGRTAASLDTAKKEETAAE